jgi:hypothetical protein
MYEAILTVNPENNEVAKTVSMAYKKLLNTNLHASP